MFKRMNGLVAGAVALGVAALAGAAEARSFVETKIDLDMKSGNFKASFLSEDGTTKELTSPRQIADGIFARIDLSIDLADADIAKEVRRRVDDSFNFGEPSGCGPEEVGQPWTYGPLTMEDGLRYTFTVNVPSADNPGSSEQISALIFPGDRSTHFANDVFCEYGDALGTTGGVLRLTGFYHVIHRKTNEGWAVQLRAVELTPAEIEKNFP